MKKLLTVLALISIISICKAQECNPKYKVLYCDTIGHILRIVNATDYPKKGVTVYVNKIRMRVISTDVGKYTYGDGLKGANIYVVRY